MKKRESLLFEVIEEFIKWKESAKSENPVVREFAEKLLEVNIWEMWALTQ